MCVHALFDDLLVRSVLSLSMCLCIGFQCLNGENSFLLLFVFLSGLLKVLFAIEKKIFIFDIDVNRESFREERQWLTSSHRCQRNEMPVRRAKGTRGTETDCSRCRALTNVRHSLVACVTETTFPSDRRLTIFFVTQETSLEMKSRREGVSCFIEHRRP